MPARLMMSVLLAIVLFAPGAPPPNHWPQFRGPGSLGVADDPALPDKWSTTENVAWKTPIPGMGWSSPIVWGDRIFLTTVVSAGEVETPKKGLYFGGERQNISQAEHRWMVYCLDFKSGRVLWEREVHRGTPPSTRHLKNSYASETPVTDGERVYAYFGNLGVFAFDFNGKQAWKVNFPVRKTRFGWGTAASPIVHRDRLYIVNDNDEESALLAFDKRTGRELWRTPREKGTNWATPFIWETERRTEIVTPGFKKIDSYDLDGKPLWELKGMSTIAIPTPFTKFGLLYVASGYVGDQHRPVYAIKPGAAGDISLKEGETSSSHVAWYLPQGGPYNPSPIVYGDHYYTLLDRGFFTCHDARTGREIYGKQRIDPASGAFTASPWAANGKIFCLSEDGDTYVIEAGAEYKLVGKNSLDEMCMATPAVARGSLLLRTASQIYRISRGGK